MNNEISGDLELECLTRIRKRLLTKLETDGLKVAQIYAAGCQCESNEQVDAIMAKNSKWDAWYQEQELASWSLTPRALVKYGGVELFRRYLLEKRLGCFE